MDNRTRMKVNQVVGLIIAGLNLFGTAHWLWLLYAYHFAPIFWFFMYPDWVLLMNSAIGLTGIYIGIRLFRNQISLIFSILIEMAILSIGLLITSLIIR